MELESITFTTCSVSRLKKGDYKFYLFECAKV